LAINSIHINKVSKAVLLSPAIKPKITLRSIRLAFKINQTTTKDFYLIQNQKIMGIEFPRFYHKVFAIKPLFELKKMINSTKKQLKHYLVDSIIVISKK